MWRIIRGRRGWGGRFGDSCGSVRFSAAGPRRASGVGAGFASYRRGVKGEKPKKRFELLTPALRKRCSTVELLRRLIFRRITSALLGHNLFDIQAINGLDVPGIGLDAYVEGAGDLYIIGEH